MASLLDSWVPIIDVSEHQGAIDFALMKARGVRGVIIRACHATTEDARFTHNAQAAIAVFGIENVGFYVFVNPKRGSASSTAKRFLELVLREVGHTNVLLMLDVESYRDETPNKGFYFPPATNAAFLAALTAELRTRAPGATVIGYTNKSYFDRTTDGICDPAIAADLDWIGARYPVYSTYGYQLHPVPEPALWPGWAYSLQPRGPILPTGARSYEAWQFSAGYNGQGAHYGCSSTHLDLNIVLSSTWDRWTKQTTVLPVEGAESAQLDPVTGGEDVSVDLLQDSRSVWATGDWVTCRRVSQNDINVMHMLGRIARLADGSPRITAVEDGVINNMLDVKQVPLSLPAPPAATPAVYDLALDVPSVPGRATGVATPRG